MIIRVLQDYTMKRRLKKENKKRGDAHQVCSMLMLSNSADSRFLLSLLDVRFSTRVLGMQV